MTEILFECFTCEDKRQAITMIDWGTMFEYKCITCKKYTQVAKCGKEKEV